VNKLKRIRRPLFKNFLIFSKSFWNLKEDAKNYLLIRKEIPKDMKEFIMDLILETKEKTKRFKK